MRGLVASSILGGALAASLALAACDESIAATRAPIDGGGEAATIGPDPARDAALESAVPMGDPVDVPLDGVTSEQLKTFSDGDALFGLPLREADGLGPLYVRAGCSACHEGGGRGPGLVQKMSVVLADGLTPAADQSLLPFGHTVRPLLAADAKTPILAPSSDAGADAGGAHVRVSVRVGPPIFGRGYMEAISDGEIERVAAEQAARTDGVHGRVNRVKYASQANSDRSFHAHAPGDLVIGRFGVKARIATLDDFTADALQGDMGITSPLRPGELENPDGLVDDRKAGVDVGYDAVNLRANYMRLVAIPRRDPARPGAALFAAAGCDACHTPSLRTRADYPIAQLAAIDAPIYSDLLLHDMGPGLSDGMVDGVDGQAHAADWRTAPLIGLRFMKTFLHDSRAHSVEEAILLHDSPGSEAHAAVTRFQALSPSDRATLLEFVDGL